MSASAGENTGAELPAPATTGRRPGASFGHVVGIGASAGGLEALTEFLRAMRPDSGMAFVVVCHLGPEHKSALVEILARVTAMPVREVEEGMAVEPNHVYVLPPGRNLVLTGGALHLRPRAESHAPQMPVDTFLRSLAGDRRNRAVGVVLSGTGSDGTLGLEAIKEEGGLTFAQDDSARHSGMPRSAVAAGVVDAVLSPAGIAAELLHLSSHPPATLVAEAPPAGSPEEQAFLHILKLLSDTSGVDFLHYRQSTMLRRIERRLALRRLQHFNDYLDCLRQDAVERKLLFEEVLIPVTSFFREPEVYEVLQKTILPRLLANRPPRKPFRVWVPGCSTGEEAYSIAICLLEYLETTPEAVPVKIFATDISERAIEAARAGLYGEGIVADVSTQRLQRFFHETDQGYQINAAVRDLCVFARQDLTRDPPFSQLDLISCRNVLIYLGPDLQGRVLSILHYALEPGGILVLGSSETVGSFTHLFKVVDGKHRFYARTSIPSRLTFDFTPGPPARTPVGREGPPERDRDFPEVYRHADRVVLARYAPSGVVVDDNLRVIQFRGDTGPYLEPAPGPPTTELLMMAREGLLGELRDALKRVRRDNSPARKEGVRVKTNDHFQDIDLEVIPITDPSSTVRHFLVLFEAARGAAGPETPGPRSPVPPPAVDESAKDRELSQMKHDLATTRLYLESVIEQKEAANEELRAANEEVICANEELQSTNEELTTAREELQATNEELTTVNDELQNRIRSASQLADDLVNLIETTRIPIVVLGSDFCIRRFTPTAQEVMNLRPSDVGRPLGHLKTRINVPDLELLIQEAIDTLEIKQREVIDEAGSWHKLYIRPYKTLDHKVGGAILMLVDIDALKRREQEIKESRDYSISIVETVREPLLVLDGGLRVRTANRAFYQNFQTTPADTEGRLIYELGNGQWNIPGLRSLLEDILPRNAHLENFEVEHVFPTIGERTMLLNAHHVVQGEGAKEQLILLAIEDVTIRKRAERLKQEMEERLRRLKQETEERLRTMVDTAVDAIVTIDDRGSITSINAATERMFGYPASELIGQNVKVLMPSPYRDEHDGYLARYLRMGEPHIIGIGREVHGRRKDGSVFPVDLAVNQFEDRGQRMFTGVLRDLSARKALEREVLEVATLEQQRIGQELHDTSAQELTALGLLADSLVASLEEESSGQARIAGKMADGLKRVLGQVRAFSRGLIRVNVDAEGLMAALAELAAQTSELHGVHCTFACREAVQLADNHTATQLYCIAREAITNALKHAQARNITISLESADRSLVLRVVDDGIGFSEPPVDTRGMGLKTMRYRAGLIDAHLSIAPGERGGTAVTCACNREPLRGEK